MFSDLLLKKKKKCKNILISQSHVEFFLDALIVPLPQPTPPILVVIFSHILFSFSSI